MQTIYMLTAVDVRRAEKAGTSRALTIAKLTIPPIKFATAGHNPGGGVMAVDYTLPRIETLEPKFMVKGLDTEVFGGLGERDRWVFAGAYKDKFTGRDIPARAVIEGAVSQWEPDESDPVDFQGCNHSLTEVTHFELTLDGQELFYIDAQERILRRNGVDLFAGVRGALGA
ncbi:probable bacteriophage protein [Stappia aggregata IAM 12614]|jgi:P2 family phage contractile tail tube protein|uniref:Probable bacteriophage protein n=1 Tax=Roseibium aggregatum (strain ATCC 25650 / DSM 13394 / JCM 20685 / NBRC 16684 / NCIMB 2208 / IAM 12614 / B1) TaxID=384765 RepID=A0NQ98_ROSAI|nr:phage major tail tube protein [Roseibium aggregatum]EAV44956.1 probable bacteriophage protein [Stappia aggregata IAM 12614] [Roseibium aggregatum IAM 12614]